VEPGYRALVGFDSNAVFGRLHRPDCVFSGLGDYGYYGDGLMAITYEINSTAINAGIQATWPPIETGQNADATQKLNGTWYNHIWRAETMEMGQFEVIEPLKGSAFTELKSTGQAVPNTGDTFATGKVMDVQGRHVGRQMKNVVVRFLVDVTS
jgi:hypothetical protein